MNPNSIMLGGPRDGEKKALKLKGWGMGKAVGGIYIRTGNSNRRGLRIWKWHPNASIAKEVSEAIAKEVSEAIAKEVSK